MNFSLKVKDNTNIFTIKNILRERHGQMEDLRICFTAFTEGNEVKNDMLTLAGNRVTSKLRKCLMINAFLLGPNMDVTINFISCMFVM